MVPGRGDAERNEDWSRRLHGREEWWIGAAVAIPHLTCGGQRRDWRPVLLRRLKNSCTRQMVPWKTRSWSCSHSMTGTNGEGQNDGNSISKIRAHLGHGCILCGGLRRGIWTVDMNAIVVGGELEPPMPEFNVYNCLCENNRGNRSEV